MNATARKPKPEPAPLQLADPEPVATPDALAGINPDALALARLLTDAPRETVAQALKVFRIVGGETPPAPAGRVPLTHHAEIILRTLAVNAFYRSFHLTETAYMPTILSNHRVFVSLGTVRNNIIPQLEPWGAIHVPKQGWYLPRAIAEELFLDVNDADMFDDLKPRKVA